MPEDTNEYGLTLEGYQGSFINSGNGKGIATYYNAEKIEPEGQVKMKKFQIGKFRHETMDIITVYRSQTGHSVELLEELKKMIGNGRITLITGDFNACFMENFNNRLIQGLLSLGFNQLIHEPTHIRGRNIDHAYLLDPTGTVKPIIERYSPYYSDHDSICITIPNAIPETNSKLNEVNRS